MADKIRELTEKVAKELESYLEKYGVIIQKFVSLKIISLLKKKMTIGQTAFIVELIGALLKQNN